jgi:ferritin
MFVLVEQMLQNEVTLERTNSTVYRSMADDLENKGWGGSAKWMRKSSDDELTHADKFAGLLVDRNITPVYASLPAIELVEGELPAYFRNAYAAEQKTTAAIEQIYKQAHDEGEFLVTQFLQYFLEEQRKSEREVWDIIQMLEASDEWRLIDEKLGEV